MRHAHVTHSPRDPTPRRQHIHCPLTLPLNAALSKEKADRRCIFTLLEINEQTKMIYHYDSMASHGMSPGRDI
jgi:hypothetical protein